MDGSRKAAVVLAYVVALSVTFLAGRQFEGKTLPFTHAEVENIAATCGEGEFVGSCTKCMECESYEFLNGGCSGFKDSFCSFCESVPHCIRENTECTGRYDSECVTCNCEDPVKRWGDIEINFFEHEKMEVPEDQTIESLTHGCYFGKDCAACSVCPQGQWQMEACNQYGDTQCEACTQCGEDEYVKEVCTFDSNTVCAKCHHCAIGTTTTSTCSSPLNGVDNHFLVQGANAECAECHECESYEWASGICHEFTDTQCTLCSSCDENEFIKTECDQGHALQDGRDMTCSDCEALEPGFYESQACLKSGFTDTIYSPCTTCKTGQYQETMCSPTNDPRKEGKDTVCPQCEAVHGCPEAHVVCRNLGNSQCSNCDQAAQWFPQTCCEEGYVGQTCEYKREEYSCGTRTYRERSAYRGGFFDNGNGVEGDDFGAFVAWCGNICSDFTDCTAFEVQNLGWDHEVEGDTVCALKNAPTVLEFDDSGLTCYSKLSLNDEAAIDQRSVELGQEAEKHLAKIAEIQNH